MRCYICDAALKEPVFNNDHQDIEPCPTCLIIIDETIGSFGVKAYATDDDFADEEQIFCEYNWKDDYD